MRKRLQLLLILFLTIRIFSQEGNLNIPSVFPSSPETYNLGNYGNINIGEYTGTMQQEIPIFEYTIGDIKLPISLQYSSNGIKVDDYNPTVGLGWMLSAGGVISKITRDSDDLNFDFKWQKYNTVPNGIKLNFYRNVILQDKFDTEKDLFRVNIPGVFSTTFIKKGDDFDNNEWLQEKKSDFKIEKQRDQFENIYFIITSPEGIKYYFELTEISQTRSEGFGWSPPDISLDSAYFLTKIIDTKNNIVTIEYEPESSNYTLNKLETYNFFENSYYINCPRIGGLPLAAIPGLKTGSILARYSTFRIKKITNNITNNQLDFIYANKLTALQNRSSYLDEIRLSKNQIIDRYKLDYLITSNDRVFLKEVASDITAKKYQFEYNTPQNLPKRLSYAQDIWGYYNGVTKNNSLISKVDHPFLENQNYSFADRSINPLLSSSGMLSKIIYPTNGYTNIYYEPNSEWGKKITPSVETNKGVYIKTDEIENIQTGSLLIHSGKEHIVRLTGGLSEVSNCVSPKPPGTAFTVAVKVQNLTTGEFITLKQLTASGYVAPQSQAFYSAGNRELYFDAKANTDYEITIKLQDRCKYASVRANYYDLPDLSEDANVPVGGNRVERVEHFDNSSSSANVEKWYYGHKSQLEKSSGLAFYKPVLWKYSEGFVYCPPSDGGMDYNYTPYRYVTVYGNSVIPLYGNENQNVSYNYVTKSYGGTNFEKGGKFTEYNVNIDPIAGNLFGYNSTRGGNFTNSAWNKGLVKNTEYLILNGNSFKTLKEVNNEYYYNTNKREEIESLTSIKYGSPQMLAQPTYKCTQQDINMVDVGYNNCIGKTVNYEFPYITSDYLMMFGEILRYKFISHDYYLKKTTTKETLDNGNTITVENYNYNNTNNFQLSSKETELSNGNIINTAYTYAHEKPNQKLIDANMVGIPLIIETTKTADGVTKTISKTETIYPDILPDTQTGNLLLPKSVSSLDLLTGGMLTDVTYNQYDSKGNLQQYITKSGITTAIVWGYNNTQPIAKIEGATYSQVSSLAGTMVTASDTDASAGVNNDETSLLDFMKTFREALPNYQVTTYTYDPLVGVRSITPPNGIRQVYIYDTSNRLKEIRENSQSGNLLKEYQYNYKH